jgi:hypothetical protein
MSYPNSTELHDRISASGQDTIADASDLFPVPAVTTATRLRRRMSEANKAVIRRLVPEP